MAYVGTPIDTANQFQSLQGKRFNGDGSTTDFTLDVAPSSTLDIEVFVENVRQDPNSAYSLSGTTLTFTGAPASGTNNIYVVHQAKAVGTIEVPASNSGDTTFNGTITMNGGVVLNEESADVDFRVESNGNANMIKVDGGNDRVGIGLASPLSEFHVDAAAGAATEARVSAGTVYTKIISDDASGFSAIDYSHDLRFKDAGTEKARINSSGNLLINTTSTTINASNFGTKITNGLLSTSGNVNGGSTVTESFGNAGQIRFMGDGDAENTNNSYGGLSDRTLKENETSASSQWDDIKALQIKNYNLIAYPDRPHLGVIAQDLESAGMTRLVKTYSDILYTEEDDLPEGVSVGDVKEKGYKAVKYSVLYMKAVKALQEAMTKIETLETEMTALKARVTTLEG